MAIFLGKRGQNNLGIKQFSFGQCPDLFIRADLSLGEKTGGADGEKGRVKDNVGWGWRGVMQNPYFPKKTVLPSNYASPL